MGSSLRSMRPGGSHFYNALIALSAPLQHRPWHHVEGFPALRGRAGSRAPGCGFHLCRFIELRGASRAGEGTGRACGVR